MRKRIFSVFLVLMLVLLSGCACEHEWQEADCLNPQVCTKCEETGAEALGHDWEAASCEAPETCLRCGEIRGTVLEHSFGDWFFAEETMSHTCSVCGLEESTEMDRAVYLETLLPGYWEGNGLFRESEFYSAYRFNIPLDMLHFGENRSFAGRINMEEVAGTWSFLEYEEDGADQDYHFSLEIDGKTAWYLLFTQKEDEDLVYIFYPNGDQLLLSRNQDVAEALVTTGSWGAEGGTGMYSLTFHEDRRVTGNLGSDFEGTWQLMPMQELAGMEELMTDTRRCGLYIQYKQGEEEVSLMATITPSRANMYDTRTEGFTPGELTLRYQDSRYTFKPMSAQEISAKEKFMQEGPNSLMGTWSSLYWRKHGYQSAPYKDTALLGYSITFHSDNTFTANVGREITGTWKYNSERSNTANATSGSYAYTVHIKEDNSYHNLTLYYQENAMPELIFPGSSATPGNSKDLRLGKLSETDKQVIQSLIGDWTSQREDINDHITGESTQTDTMDYGFTFCEDGTFTGNNGRDLKGFWHLDRIFYNDDGTGSYYFDLSEDGADSPHDVIIYDHGDEQMVEYRESTTEYQRWIRLKQYSQEDLDAAALGPTFPLGEWVSTAVTRYGDETKPDERIETDAYSFTVYDDGTFTAKLDTVIQGTWNFMEYQTGSGYTFRFDYPGKYQYSSPYFFVSKENDFLSFRIMSPEQESFYQMERK